MELCQKLSAAFAHEGIMPLNLAALLSGSFARQIDRDFLTAAPPFQPSPLATGH